LRIVVCTKETPDTTAKVEVDAQGNVTWGDTPVILNPWDEYAVEEGLLLKEKFGGECSVIGMGAESTLEALKHALAMGCDDATLITDPAYAGADTLLTSHVLAQAIGKMGDVRLVLMGKQAIDGDTGQTAVQTARRLGWPALTYVSKVVAIDFDAGTITVERLLEEGRQVCESKLPALVAVVKDINEPRYPSFMGIKKASKAEVPRWSAADVGTEAGIVSKVTWPAIYAPPERVGECEIIEAETLEEAAATLADKIIAEKVV
jgi:electron transfer flavoprotein beta subunit